ncbi:MAG: hypothetical protein ACI4VW_00970 [Acutalibacteraceae bacterium]
MLILKITDEVHGNRRNRNFLRKKTVNENLYDFRRSSVRVNGKNVVVLEITESSMDCDDVQTLLKIYQGRILLSKGKEDVQVPESMLFNPNKYYMRAILSSLANQINTVNKEWKRIFIKIDDFEPFKEFYRIVKLSKSLCLQTQKNSSTNNFVNTCYNEYGAVVKIREECNTDSYDVFLNLEEIDKSGKLIIDINGTPTLLYPDITYFENDSEYQKLACFGIDYNIICAAFSDK